MFKSCFLKGQFKDVLPFLFGTCCHIAGIFCMNFWVVFNFERQEMKSFHFPLIFQSISLYMHKQVPLRVWEKTDFFFFSFSAHRNMRTIPNAFLANMSLADLLLASLNCSFNFVTMRDRKWVFGSTYCKLNNFMAIVTVAASVLNLTAMSLDR